MKILVLMPLDEKWSYVANALYQNLSPKAKQCTFALPMFSEWQRATKNYVFKDIADHWNVATFGSLIKAREVCSAALQRNEDLIVIGNVAKMFEFDVVFNFQDMEFDAKYKDKYLEKLAEVFKSEPLVVDLLTDVHTADESTMPLHNISAAAAFLSAYLETDPHIEELKQRYQDVIYLQENSHGA